MKSSKKTKKTDSSLVAPIFTPRTRTVARPQDGGASSRDGGRSPSPGSDTSEMEQDLGPATRQDIRRLQDFIAEELARNTRALTAEVQVIGTRTARLEERAEAFADTCNTLAHHAETLATRVETLEEALEDLSNRSRRNNIRLRGLPESVTPDALDATLTGIMKKLLPALPPARYLIDRIHRTLGARKGQNAPPRDVVARLHYYSTREALLRTARDQQVEYEDGQLLFYQDLAPSTLAKRREWRVVTELLRSHNVRYSWGFPFRILVHKDGRTYSCTHLYRAQDFLHQLGLEVPDAIAQPPLRVPCRDSPE
uniref:L1 transposable element RRM domain-containing protein n=1 Tax=Leptobrachium leishanense TaxID=445787 RepID=A0A8C5QQ06_9ANUR